MVNKNSGVLVVGDNQTPKQASSASKLPSEMDAIALGIEAKLDPFSAYQKVVTQRTVGIAQQLRLRSTQRR